MLPMSGLFLFWRPLECGIIGGWGDKNGFKLDLLWREEKAEEIYLGKNRAPKVGRGFVMPEGQWVGVDEKAFS